MKEIVKRKYSAIALQINESSCCGSGCCGDGKVYSIMNEDYSRLSGYDAEADLGLGCGLPTEFAAIREGDVVVDLGSGAGNDCFVARAVTGETGQVIGIDFSPEMIAKAKKNVSRRGFANVEFHRGDIENIPVESDTADVVISNCVLNLLPSKNKVFTEIYRVLKPGGHFCISDIVLVGELPRSLREAVELYVGCIAGAIQKNDYLELVDRAGYVAVKIQKEKEIRIPDDILAQYLHREEMESFKNNRTAVVSMTLTGDKPGTD